MGRNIQNDPRRIRQRRVRRKIRGSDSQPRLCVYKSLKYTYAQLISDESGKVIASASSRTGSAAGKSASSVESAKIVGQKIAELAKSKNMTKIVFDRNGYLYHGRIAAVADGAREGGLKF